MRYRPIDTIHAETLRRIDSEGGISGINFYRQHVNDYEMDFNRTLRKLEIVAAIEQKHHFFGIRVKSKDRSKKLTTEDSIDFVINGLYNILRSSQNRANIRVAPEYPPFSV